MGRHASRHADRGAADRRQCLSQPVAEPGPRRARFTLACGSGQLLAELIGQHMPSIDMQGLAPRAA